MEEDLKKEDVTFRLKNLLQNDNVKLWLPPYFNEEKETIAEIKVTEHIQKLATQYHQVLNANVELCVELLLQMQKKSIHRLKEKEQFKSQGLATVRVKVPGKQLPEFSVQLLLSSLTDALKNEIGGRIGTPAERLKLIASGKVLIHEKTLNEQGVKHGSIVLVLILPPTTKEDPEAIDDDKILQETKKDIEFLTSKRLKKQYLSITNQSGHFLDMPKETQTALVTAMALHEKGRSAFKKSRYSLALLFYLEADNEFKSCQAEILNKVDNYALLNLDIVWCYLHLQSFQHLLDAESRLKICETSLLRAYGSNFERLSTVKEACGNERVLMMRLHLLQAILYHLQNKKEAAGTMFDKVEVEIQQLKTDNDKIQILVGLGYKSKESALALRAACNNLDMAVNHILAKQKQKEDMRLLNKIKWTSDCHICANGTAVNPELVQQMMTMGFSQLIASQALKCTYNNVNTSLMWIRDFDSKLQKKYPDFIVDLVKSIDINEEKVQRILAKCSWTLNDECIRKLICNSIGKEQVESLFARLNSEVDFSEYGNLCQLPTDPCTSSGPSKSAGTVPKKKVNNEESDDSTMFDEETSEEMVMRLKEDISESAEDYLDSSLDAEEKFFALYKSFLN